MADVRLLLVWLWWRDGYVLMLQKSESISIRATRDSHTIYAGIKNMGLELFFFGRGCHLSDYFKP
jgi:hypothetical protein